MARSRDLQIGEKPRQSNSVSIKKLRMNKRRKYEALKTGLIGNVYIPPRSSAS